MKRNRLLGILLVLAMVLAIYLSTRNKSCTYATDFEHPQEEFTVESGNKAL